MKQFKNYKNYLKRSSGWRAKRDHVTAFLRELTWLKVDKIYENDLDVMKNERKRVVCSMCHEWGP